MGRARKVTFAFFATAAACVLQPRAAEAAPPGDWSVGVERVFGISRVTVDTEVGNVSTSSTSTSVSLFSAFSGLRGYSSARLAFDYLASSSLTFGGAFAYESIGADADESVWLLAARVGYFARPTPSFGVWPRAGLTHVAFDDDGPDDDPTATGLTLEVPLVFLVLGQNVGLSLIPHADIGIAGGTDDVDQKVTELGLQFGLNAFF